MGILSKKDAALILDPLADNNPITIQVLGICSALAITAELEASIVMAVSVLFVMGMGNVVISLMRNIIPSKIRIIVQLVVVATLVIVVDQVKRSIGMADDSRSPVPNGKSPQIWSCWRWATGVPSIRPRNSKSA